jgi:hypothetical protein
MLNCFFRLLHNHHVHVLTLIISHEMKCLGMHLNITYNVQCLVYTYSSLNIIKVKSLLHSEYNYTELYSLCKKANGVDRKIHSKMVTITQRVVSYEVTIILEAVQFEWTCNWGPEN